MKRFALAAKVTLALSIAALGLTVPAARADVYETYTFVPGSTTTFPSPPFSPLPYNIFGSFTVDLTNNSLSSSDFWVQAQGATNGEYTASSGALVSPDQVQGYDITGNNITLTFGNSFPATGLDPLVGVNFDNAYYGSNSTGGVENAAATPEPSLTILVSGMMIGLLGMAVVAKRRKAAQQ